MDVENSKEKTVDKKTREELGNLSVIFWQDQYFVENNEAESSLVEENKYRNYYQGFTLLRFPFYYNGYLVSRMNTSKTSGSVKTYQTPELNSLANFSAVNFSHILHENEMGSSSLGVQGTQQFHLVDEHRNYFRTNIRSEGETRCQLIIWDRNDLAC